MSNRSDATLYTNSMSRIRQRVDLIEKVFKGSMDLDSDAFTAELIFLQFRKILEEMAFPSLAANKEKYSEAHATFSQHWNASRILEAVSKLNPGFYPIPLGAPTWNGEIHFEPIDSGFLTEDEFAILYQASSEVLHTRNPYREGDPTIHVKYTVGEWISRIQTLLSWHQVVLLDGGSWIVHIPPRGPVQAFPTQPADAPGVNTSEG
ncbi:hypothetical protein [Tunturiibacter gelidoferens]|uniref:Uncharacterized protein n=1 Tax=Tunturiibacter lichenicola TaxID=2051959 RepID=A0A7Y9NKJ6_9BACT|nr:hypothetical protein [Edaphobacter lichenicola]NYF51085.1 hypothetical protein [Edaphobacter lichenicola]